MRRRLSFAVGAAAAVVVAGLPVSAPVFGPGRSILRVDDRVLDTSSVALTFDDGPHPDGTPAALAALDRLGVKATFFLVGEQVARRPGLAAEIAARGHRIGLHTYTHRVATWISPRAFREELDRTAAVISEATGRMPELFRPPRGVFTYSALAEVRRRGLHPVLWAADGRDWRASATPLSISGRIAGRLTGGEVVLLHDSDFYSSPGAWKSTIDALPLLLSEVRKRGLLPAPLSRRCFSGAV
jgi:peptidoglycan/xylan/chitin deacetylase (PgdA/CDA1 family)